MAENPNLIDKQQDKEKCLHFQHSNNPSLRETNPTLCSDEKSTHSNKNLECY